jgi:hypothetical protein
MQPRNSAADEIGLTEPIRADPGLRFLEVSMSTILDTTVVLPASAAGVLFARELRSQVRRASLALEVAACNGEDVLEHPAWGRIAELLDIARRHNVDI